LEDLEMSQASRAKLLVGAAVLSVAGLGSWRVYAQASAEPTNDAPNPYQTIEGFFKMPEGRTWGSTSAVDIDRDGRSIWVAERCGANACIDRATNQMSQLDPVLKFDSTGKLVTSFGKGMIVFPHGIHVDAEGNVWVTDGQDNAPQAARGGGGGRGAGGRGGGAADAAGGGGRAAGGAAQAGGGGRGAAGPNPAATIGHQVFKFSPQGKVLLTIGRAGGATGPTECCWQPNDVITNAAGEIFISEGHGGNPNDRIIKFSRDGKFMQAWGTRGSGPVQFNQPHALAFDSQGRLFVGDRGNNRVLIFDRNMNQVADWPQFSRPSGLFIDRNDNLYSADSESGSVNAAHKAWIRGIRAGSVKDGKITAFIPDPQKDLTSGTLAAEGVAVDAQGNVYGAEVGPRKLQKYVRK
jgi:sugar lactone lactonase YvrE